MRNFKGTSLNTKWLYARRMMINKFIRKIPYQLWIGVTYNCQCKCTHCFLGPDLNNRTDEMDQQTIYDLIDTARKMGIMEICFFGGEPLLREDIVDLVKYVTSKGMFTSIFTNGIRLDREKAEALHAAGLYRCNISLDSAIKEQHDSLRGYSGCFDRVVEGIKNVAGTGTKCSIWTYAKKDDVQNKDMKDLKSIIDLGHELNVFNVVILFPVAAGNWLCSSENILSLEERERVRSLRNPPFTVMEFPSEDAECMGGKKMIYINPRGDVSLCPAMPFFYGNIHKDSLNSIFNKLQREHNVPNVKGCGECTMNIEDIKGKHESDFSSLYMNSRDISGLRGDGN